MKSTKKVNGINDYQKKVHLFACYGNNAFYPMLGLAEECGEVLGKVAKFIRKHNGIVPKNSTNAVSYASYAKQEDIEDSEKLKRELKAELGDVCWMVAEVCNVFGLKMQEVLDCNISKLADRKARGVIVGNGDYR